jgi:peptidoglycan/LPS O-acetylase OafA/YrhL
MPSVERVNRYGKPIDERPQTFTTADPVTAVPTAFATCEESVAIPKPQRIPEIDGLRAIAVLMVVAYHFDLHLRGGFIGVDVFFVVSGFVITRMLLTTLGEQQSTKSILRDFYVRRGWRLLPSLVAVIIATVAATIVFPGPDRAATIRNAMAGLSGIANWWTVNNIVSKGLNPLSHTWSLAIEEQFYLLLPLVLATFRRRAAQAAVVFSALLIFLSALTFFLTSLNDTSINHTYFSSIARATPIALGTLLAVAVRQNAIPGSTLFQFGRLNPTLLLCTLGFFLLPTLAFADFNSQWLYRGGFLLLAVVLAGIVAASLQLAGTNALLARLLRIRPLQIIGDRSYAIYLTHFPLALRFESFGRIERIGLKILLTIVATELLHRVVEQPLRTRGPKSKFARALPIAQLLLVVGGIAFLLVTD